MTKVEEREVRSLISLVHTMGERLLRVNASPTIGEGTTNLLMRAVQTASRIEGLLTKNPPDTLYRQLDLEKDIEILKHDKHV